MQKRVYGIRDGMAGGYPRNRRDGLASIRNGGARAALIDSGSRVRATYADVAADDSALESRRRQVTVLFADVSGFTDMSERMDAEDVTAVMNSCFKLLEQVIREHGGVVDKYIGDSVMALFGAPRAIENAPRRALAAALEMRVALAQFNSRERLGTPLDVHMGINTGEVIAGDVGGEVKRDFTVMGDTVNLAARLEDASTHGKIFVGPTTYFFTRDDFEFRPLPPLVLKGKAEPVRAWELVAARDRRERPRLGSSLRQIASELVGRERELAMLRQRVEALLQGRGGIVSLIAEAGLGKSRIVAELAGLPELAGATLLEGRSHAMGRSLGYHPFLDLLRGWAGLRDHEDDRASLARLAETISAVAPGRAGDITPFVATLLGVRLEGEHAARLEGIQGEALERLIVKSMSDLVQALAAQAPVVLFFEDLHWADTSSVKLLEVLQRSATSQRVLFVYAARPDHPATSGHVLAGAQQRCGDSYLEIVLAPLDERASARLIQNLLRIDDLPHRVRSVIARKAEGNPFFIEEIVRWLLDQGALEMERGRLRTTERIHSVVIPGTVQEVILVRTEQLEEPLQRVLQVGSVIGRRFHQRILEDVLGDVTDLAQRLECLERRQLIVPQEARRSSSFRRAQLTAEREYVFKHALIQETIYQSMLNRARRALHLEVARSIERTFGDRLADFYATLAFHYGCGEDLEKAEEYLFKAGDEAVRSAASSEALEHFREASRLYMAIHGAGGDPARKALLERNIAAALMNTGDLIEAVPHFDRALELLGEKVPRTRWQLHARFVRDIVAIVFRMYVRGGRRGGVPASEAEIAILSMLYDRARAQTTTDAQRFFFDSMASVRRLNAFDPSTVPGAFAFYAGGAILFAFSGVSYAMSRRFIDAAQALLREDRIGDLLTFRLMKSMCDYFEGRWDEPSEVDDELIERTLRSGQVWDVDTFLGIDAEKAIDEGRFADAEARLEKIKEIVQGYGYDYARSNQYALTAFLALARRRLDEALLAVRQYYDERPEDLLNLIALGTKAKVEILLGRRAEAATTLADAEVLLARLALPPPFHVGAYRTSRFLLDLVELEGAIAARDRVAVARWRKQAKRDGRQLLAAAAKMARLRVEAYRLMARFHWIRGRRRRALRWWARSCREGERLGARPELARTCAEIAQRLEGSGIAGFNGRPVRELRECAREIFRTLSLDAELAELEDRPPNGQVAA